jgi:hypothetical protein
MIRKLAGAALCAAMLAVVAVTGCDTKADKGATTNTNPQKPNDPTEGGGAGGALPPAPKIPFPPGK